MGKQKIVVKLSMQDAKKRSKALKIVVGIRGVLSVAVQGADQNQIVVIGDGVDSITLTTKLRKKMGYVELVSVSSFDKEDDEKKGNPGSIQPIIWPYNLSVEPPYQYKIYDTDYYPPCCFM